MTLPIEEKRTIENTYEFLFDLINPQKTPKVPLYIRDKARLLIRHYPYPHRIDELWGEEE